MRSLSTAIVAAAGALALAACGGSGESSKASNAPAATDTTAAVEPAPAETAAPDATGIEPAASLTTEVVDAGAAAHADSTMSMADAASVAPEGAVVPAAAAAAGGEDYAAFTGDATAGKRVFVKCLACHVVVAGQNRVGPSLYGIVGRPAGSIANFAYSPANKNSGIVWTEDVMFAYLKNPQAYIPGTKMVFPGLPSGQDRADVIAYLKSVPK